jgi:hypothetical protein
VDERGRDARATAGQETGATFRRLHNHAAAALESGQEQELYGES